MGRRVNWEEEEGKVKGESGKGWILWHSSKVHISQATKDALGGGAFNLEEAYGKMRNATLKHHNVNTYFVAGYSNTEV